MNTVDVVADKKRIKMKIFPISPGTRRIG